MPRETMEILAVWKERPSWFTSGLMQWVAEAVGPAGPYRVHSAPAFPLDDKFVDTNASTDTPYIRPILDRMDEATRKVVTTMHAEFVHSLERDDWVQTGQGSDWFNLHFERAVRL
jgi:hypothetical protein